MKHTDLKIDVVILAAGMGTRMNSDKPKVLHEMLGKPMLGYLLDAVEGLCQNPPVVVVGKGAEEVKAAIGPRTRYVLQEPQLGTADALRYVRPLLQGKSDIVLVANSDNPLITGETCRSLVAEHLAAGAMMTISTIVEDDPRGFGRIVRDSDGRVCRIVEEKAAGPEELALRELNSNPYCFNADWLWASLDKIQKSAAGEYYLTDLVEIAYGEGALVATHQILDKDEAIGINTRVHLAEATRIVQARINQRWMLAGVSMIDPSRVYIEDGVEIGRDTILYPETYLRGSTRVGQGCELGPSVILEDTWLGDAVKVKFAVLEKARLENSVDMGPFGHLRKGAHLCEHVHMGNFGEIKNSTLGKGTKMGHFSYIGDAEIGENVNIGAGTITCNYDGEKKSKTEIGDDVFLGSDTMLVAPVKMGKGSKTGAGAVVTHDVAEGETVIGVPAKPMAKKETNS